MKTVIMNPLDQTVERIREKTPGSQDADCSDGQHSDGKKPRLPLPVRYFMADHRNGEQDTQRPTSHIQNRQEHQIQDTAYFPGSDTLA